MPNIVGYHTNDAKRCLDFVAGKIVINSEDVFYLGFGMYFWDNFSNAKYWLNQKKYKHPKVKEWWIVQAEIDIGSLLDLTDEDVLQFVDRLWQDVCTKMNWDTNLPLGKKINILFDYFETLQVYTVIRGFGKYSDRTQANFLQNTRLVSYIKTIYCFRKGDLSNIRSRDVILKEVV